MPVSRGPRFNLRSAVVVGLAGVVVAVALAAGVLLLARSGGEVEILLGDRDFRDMDTDRISAEIADRGPILWPDVGGGSRDIILQHLGDDPDTGWLAFEARRPGQSRECFFAWQSERGEFANTCDADDIVDAEGTGLRHFDVSVVDGDVRVDIRAG